MQSHQELGINPLSCRDCGELFTQERSRVRHERDAHQIQQSNRPSAARSIFGGSQMSGSDSDSSIGDIAQPVSTPATPPSQVTAIVPSLQTSVSSMSPSSPPAPLLLTSPPSSLSQTSPPSQSSPPSTAPLSSGSGSSSGDGNRVYTCEMCLYTFSSRRYYLPHLNNCRYVDIGNVHLKLFTTPYHLQVQIC